MEGRSSTLYLVNPHLEVGDVQGEWCLLRLPGWAQNIEATPYQLSLLQRFEQPKTLSSVLEAYPFHREASSEFLMACVSAQFLLPADAAGRPKFPSVRRVSSTMFAAPATRADEPSAFTFMGVPFDANTTGAAGARFGPSAIRAASEGCRYSIDPHTLMPRGFIDFSSGRDLLAGITFSDAGDVPVLTGEDPSDIYDRITDAADQLFRSGTIPVFLGGDHSITYPIMRAMPHEEVGIIHFDAHTDLGDVEPSGLHHGNVFSLILERLEFVRSIHQIGLRGMCEAAPDHRHSRVSWFGMDHVRSKTPKAWLEQIPADRPYYLSVDTDVLDPAFAPSTGTPVAGGMYPHELKALIRSVCEAREIVAMDIVEVGPALSAADSTASLAVEAALTMADSLAVRLARAATLEEHHDG